MATHLFVGDFDAFLVLGMNHLEAFGGGREILSGDSPG
jgi:hypothetical protein